MLQTSEMFSLFIILLIFQILMQRLLFLEASFYRSLSVFQLMRSLHCFENKYWAVSHMSHM